MLVIRRTGLAVLAVGAVLVFILMAPDPPEEGALNLSATNYQTLINAAMSDYNANDALTESAPQQQVVNGWVARDLLQIQAQQLADVLDALTQETDTGQVVAANDPRVPGLLLMGVLAICLVGATSAPKSPATERTTEAIDVGDGRHQAQT